MSKVLTPSEARKALITIATAEVGVREGGGNNRGPRIVTYQKATWLKPDAWPWCAAFVCWCIQQWLKVEGVTAVVGILPTAVDKWRPQTAGAFDYERWAKEKGLEVVPEGADVLAGDIVIFDFSHIGIVIKDAPAKFKTLTVVEGNTNGKGERDSTSGDGVWQKERARSLAKVFIRLV